MVKKIRPNTNSLKRQIMEISLIRQKKRKNIKNESRSTAISTKMKISVYI